MGMIVQPAPHLGGAAASEDFESRFVNSLNFLLHFVSDSSTVGGGYTQVTCISEQGTGVAASNWNAKAFEPLSILRRVTCRAESNWSFLRALSASWPPVRRHRQSRSRLWFLSWKKSLWANTAKRLAGRGFLALPPSLASREGLA